MGEMNQQKPVWTGKVEETPVGPIWIATTEKGVAAVSLWDDQDLFEREVKKLTGLPPTQAWERIATVADQLNDYFHGERKEFDLTIDWSVMTPFQKKALREVYAIPFGRWLTYGDIAKHIGNPKAVRAVGRANATNPIPIIIPCHRVLGADGKLHGYGAPGGLETKAWLLRLEGSWLL